MTTETEKHLIALSAAKDAVDAELCAMRLRVKDLECHVQNQRENVYSWRGVAEERQATIARVRGEVNAYSEIIPAVALADLRAALEGEQQ